jgi:NADPH2:quinone reductase
MQAVQLTDYGSVDNFRIVDIPEPEPQANEVRIKVEFAGLRWGDIMARHGDPVRRFTPPFEWVPGQEVAGTIDRVGADVRGFKPGQRVFGSSVGGGYAEYCCVAADRVMPLADHVPLDAALAYPINLRTAWFLVYPWGKIQPGETVLVHAAAGGVGRLAVQIMKRRLWNVRVIALCGSDEKVEICKADGADHVINYRKTDYVAEVEKIAGAKPKGFAPGVDGGGVDISLNGVRGDTLLKDPLVIRKRGRWILYGHSGDKQTPIDGSLGNRAGINTAPYAYDGITIMPFSNLAWMNQPEQESARIFVKEWMEREKLIEPTVYPLSRIAEVQKMMEEGKTSGKVVFAVGGRK